MKTAIKAVIIFGGGAGWWTMLFIDFESTIAWSIVLGLILGTINFFRTIHTVKTGRRYHTEDSDGGDSYNDAGGSY